MKKTAKPKKISSKKSRPNSPNAHYSIIILRTSGFVLGTFLFATFLNLSSQTISPYSHQTNQLILGDNDESEVSHDEEQVEIKTQEHQDENETEIETSDGQKIKTKIEDDGTTKIEIEHNQLKFKYELKNEQKTTKAEHQDGKDAKLKDHELEDLEDKIENEMEDDGIQIATGAGHMTFSKNHIAAITEFPLSIDVGTRQLIVTTPAGTKTVTVLPDAAVQNLIRSKIITVLNSSATTSSSLQNQTSTISGTIKFKIKGDQAFYEIDGHKTYKLFFLIPVSRPITATVSTETGETLSIQKSFLTKVIDFFSP